MSDLKVSLPASRLEWAKPYLTSNTKLACSVDGELEGKACALAVDIDELAHALGALLRGSGHDTLSMTCGHQAAMAQHNLLGSLAFGPLASGPAGLGGVLAGATFVSGASGAAMRAGLGEWRGARKEVRDYRERADCFRDEAQATAALDKSARARIIDHVVGFTAATDERIRASEAAAKSAKDGGLIGKYSFLSGSGLMARSIVEVGRNFGIAATGHTLHPAAFAASGAIAPSVMTSTGLLSNGLAMTASALAVALGVHFVRKTGTADRALRAELPQLREHWETLTARHPAYKKFLTAKSEQRENFMKSFAMKNRLFTAGAAVYAAGTILPAAVKMLVAAGVINSKKLGANLILALFSIGIAGAVTMGIFSHQFLYGHPNLGRYEKYATAESTGFNRRLLTAIDTFRFVENGKQLPLSFSAERGAELRAAAYDMIGQREKIRAGFMQAVADATGRTHISYAHAGDDDYAERRPFPTKIRALTNSKKLRSSDVVEWLKDERNLGTCNAACADILRVQHNYHVNEALVTARMAKQIHGAAGAADADVSDFSARYLGRGIDGIERAKSIEALLEKIDGANTHETQKDALLEFLRLQTAELPKNADAEEEKSGKKEEANTDPLKITEKTPFEYHLGKYLHGELAQIHNNERGSLLEMEREAGRLRAAHPQHAEFHVFAR